MTTVALGNGASGLTFLFHYLFMAALASAMGCKHKIVQPLVLHACWIMTCYTMLDSHALRIRSLVAVVVFAMMTSLATPHFLMFSMGE